jgi:hypothetical protein
VAEIQYIPDISHHQSNPTTGARISITRMRDEGATAVIARVGQGAGLRRNGVDSYSTTRDRMWQTFLAEAKSIGFPILPYWYIGNRLSAADNAAIAADWVGDKSLKWMLDHEDASGDIAFYNAVLAAFEKRGLDVVLGYVPHWYWSIFGGGIAGPPLVNSKYINSRTGYASQIYGDGSAYASIWSPYGGNQVALGQFTNQAQMAGWKIDCSAFRGTREQFFALTGHAPAVQPVHHIERDDMIITRGKPEDGPTNCGILAGNVFLDISDDPHARGMAQDAINRGIVAEITVDDAHWALLVKTSLQTQLASRG